MNNLKLISIYPTTINNISIQSPEEHLIKSITHDEVHNIDDKLKECKILQEWLTCMPTLDTVTHIKERQDNYNEENPDLHTEGVELDFQKIHVTLPMGQVLFHGGYWFGSDADELIWTRYTSTSLDPIFATGGIHFEQQFIIKIMSPNIKCYAYDPFADGYAESEILLEKEIRLVRKKECKIKNNYGDDYTRVFFVEAYKE